MVLYVQEPGATVRLRSESLEVCKQGASLYSVPLLNVERLVIIGVAQVTTQALHALGKRGCDVIYMRRNGQTVCTMHSVDSGSVFLRLAQFERYRDESYRLAFAKEIIRAKIASQIAWVRSQHHPDKAEEWNKTLDRMEHILETVPNRQTLDELRGAEGIASKDYFHLYSMHMRRMPFHSRTRRPAKDPVNALLNLGYAFVCNECVSLLEAQGLDAGIGFLHGVRYGRLSFALDVMEPFRSMVTDRLVGRLVNWGMIQEDDFTHDAKTGFRLRPDGFRTFLDQYEKQMADDKPALRVRLRQEIGQIRHAIFEGTPYRFGA